MKKNGVSADFPENGTRVGFRPAILAARAAAGLSATMISVAGALLVAACGSVPPQNYYVLTPVAAPANAGAMPVPNAAAIDIVVEQAHVPQLVDRPQLVISHSDHRVTILEQQRWAEPLRVAIPRVIARDIERELAVARA